MTASRSQPSGEAARYASDAAYEIRDRGTRTIVVLLHGLGGDRSQPLGLTADQFGDCPFTVLAPDARAHGDTATIGPTDRFTTASLAEDLDALLDHLGMAERQLILIGISMGAAVALQLARTMPDRVAGTLAIRPSFATEPWPRHLRVFGEIAELLRTVGPSGADAFAASESFRLIAAHAPSAAASLLAQFSRPLAVERVVRLDAVPANVSIDWTGRLHLAGQFVVVTADDPNHPRHVAELWHDRIARSELITVPSRDGEPEAYTTALDATVRRFLERFALRPADRPAGA